LKSLRAHQKLNLAAWIDGVVDRPFVATMKSRVNMTPLGNPKLA